MKDYNSMLDDLKNGKIASIDVDKNEFYEIRYIVIKREDFKHFRGIAKQGGNVSYVYSVEGRS